MALVVMALGVATPAAAQFNIKKKVKAAAANEAANKAGEAAGAEAPAAPAAAPARAGGGTVVLTNDVVNRLILGLKAGKAERERAKQEDTPYGKYHRGVTAAAAAEPKCSAAQMSWATGRAADEKLSARYTAAMDKAMAAQGKGDMPGYARYTDSALAVIDPSCAVHRPEQPQNYYEMQRDVDNRAEQQTLKTSGFDATEYGQVTEKTLAILRDPAAADVSSSESQAVKSHATELKDLMGFADQQQAERTPKAAEAPQPAPAPAPAAPTMPTAAGAVSDCEVKNLQKHQAEVQALGDRGEKASQAGNTALMMAIADTIRQIQTAGCIRGK
jgi:hypothetical protein